MITDEDRYREPMRIKKAACAFDRPVGVPDTTTSTLIDSEIEFSHHTKATDSHLYLMTTSCHPPHTFEGVPKGLATRIRRTCSSPALYQEQSSLLKSHLCNSGIKEMPDCISRLFKMDVWTTAILFFTISFNTFRKVESISCDFENGDDCGWANVNFEVSRYKSPLEKSGPKKAFQGVYYAYFDVRDEKETDAVLEIPYANGRCLFFAYHMWGSQMGSLWVNVTEDEEPLFAQAGDQGNEWHCVSTELPLDRLSTIKVHARKGGIYSIIGIDDVVIFEPLMSPCDAFNCSFTPSQIISTTQKSFLPSTSNSVDITASALTTQPPDFFTENLPLIAGVPGGLVFLLFIAGIFIVVCRKKEKEIFSEDMISDQLPRSTRNNRYRSFPHNHQHVDEEVYDEIKEGPEYSYADNYDTHKTLDEEYLKPTENNAYLKPLSLKDKDNEGGYTILPAITLPMSKVNAAYTNTPSQESDGYIDQKDLNIPNKPGKKISISDQGNVMYCDVRQTMEQKQSTELNRTYLSLSHM
ncbi:uncharacterized protein LOC133197008 [Saccostrea echinata]|uniref:uncharacterized protein LOC133197008 n=1 Tax=Saccostrea echinata TaxID=191078 RepID=UPI002A82BAE7|nr:uncharacterized protein LOC133197008 [Saccostrea echinata]